MMRHAASDVIIHYVNHCVIWFLVIQDQARKYTRLEWEETRVMMALKRNSTVRSVYQLSILCCQLSILSGCY